jgi:hypothetical protein
LPQTGTALGGIDAAGQPKPAAVGAAGTAASA